MINCAGLIVGGCSTAGRLSRLSSRLAWTKEGLRGRTQNRPLHRRLQAWYESLSTI